MTSNETELVEISFGDRRLEAAPDELAAVISKHTGASLRRVRLEFEVSGEALNAAVGDRIRDAADSGGEPLSNPAGSERWRVETWTTRYADVDPTRVSYDVTLKAAESVVADSVELPGPISLPVEQYREKIEKENGLTVELLAALGDSEAQQLESFMQEKRESSGADSYFEVVRRGVQETPRMMRFGRCLWQRLDDGRRRHYVLLVAREYDEEEPEPFLLFQPEMSQLMVAVINLQHRVAMLTNALANAGIAVPVDEPTAEEESVRKRFFDEVSDLDLYWG